VREIVYFSFFIFFFDVDLKVNFLLTEKKKEERKMKKNPNRGWNGRVFFS